MFFPDPEDVDEYARTGTAPFSLESLRPLTDFDLVGFSVTYEGDYINVVRLLRMAGIPAAGGRSRARGPGGASWAASAPSRIRSPSRPSWTSSWSGEGEELVGEIVAA